MIFFSNVFFIPLTFLFLHSLAAVSNSFYFYILLPLFLGHFQCNPLHDFSLPRLHFPSTFWASALFARFVSHLLYMTSPCAPHQFLLRSLHSNLHSQFIKFLLLTHMIILTRLFFTNLDLLLFLCQCHRF